MKSKKSFKLVDLDRDLPTSATDIMALRRARRHGIQDLKAYFDFLASFPAPYNPALSARKGPAGSKPFKL
jgi:hypothetical protein